jgi:hypothetical protein
MNGPDLSDDLLVGIKPIANWLKLPTRKVFYMAEKKHLPLFKIGKQWAGRKSSILKRFEELESGQ